MVKADGFDSAIIGVSESYPHRLIYSSNKVIEILCEKNSWTWEDALEYAEFNIFSAYVGEDTPIWCDVIDPSESLEEVLERYE